MKASTIGLCAVIVCSFSALACDSDEASPAASAQDAESTAPAPRRLDIRVTATGYEPGKVEAKAEESVILAFQRTSDEGCGEKLVFPERGIERDLPLNEEVLVELTLQKNETIDFTCGMGMYRGSLVASAR